MKSTERQRFLLTRANKFNFVSIPDSAKELKVSVETIRRDINILCEQKKLKKVHGGAVPIQAAVKKDPTYPQRFQHNPKGKTAVAIAAAALIHDGDVVTMDGGATTAVVAQHIRDVKNVTFVVNSLRIADILADKLESGEITGKLILIGGELLMPSRAAFDSYAAEQMAPFRFDIAFASASSVSASGVANTTLNGIYVRHLLQKAAVTVLVVDSEKLGGTSTYQFAMPTDFDHIIVDDLKPVPQDLLEMLEQSDTQLTVVQIQK